MKTIRYIMAIDQGTTGTQVSFFRAHDLLPCVGTKTEFKQHYPHPGWVEHDLEEIQQSLKIAYGASVSKLREQDPAFNPSHIVAIGITNQRETSCAWSRSSGKPFGPAIVWQDRRTAHACQMRRQRGLQSKVLQKTGLVLDPYFSASKFEWMLKNQPEISRAGNNQDLCFGTVDSWLVFLITGGRFHITDHTNASRTQIYDLHLKNWCPELAAEFGIPNHALPKIVNSSMDLDGETQAVTLGFLDLPDGIPILSMIGDQQSSLFGLGGTHEGDGKITFGTGAFLLVNTGDKLTCPNDGCLTTVAHSSRGNLTYAREGSAFIAGAAVQFLRDNFGWIKNAAEIEPLARSCTPDPNLYFIPALSGLGAPHWNPNAKGAIFGLTRGTTQAQIAFAVLESLAFQNAQIINCLKGALDLHEVRIDGGASANNLLAQMQAQILGKKVIRNKYLETTSYGAAKAAWLGLNESSASPNLGTKIVPPELQESDMTVFTPDTDTLVAKHTNQSRLRQWQKTCNAINSFYDSGEEPSSA